MKMTKAVTLVTTLAISLLLGGCGGNGSSNAASSEPAAAQPAQEAQPKAKQGNNPLAAQQQAIQDAKGVQALLDKDAERKKAALDNLN